MLQANSVALVRRRALSALLVIATASTAQAQHTVATIGSPGVGAGQFGAISDFELDSADRLYVVDVTGDRSRVQVFNPDHTYSWEFALTAAGGSALGMALAEAVGRLYVGRADRIQWYDIASGAFLGEQTSAGAALGAFNSVQAMAYQADPGVLWVADTGNDRILACYPDSSTCGQIAAVPHPSGIALDASGAAYVTSRGDHNVRKIDDAGTVLMHFGAMGSNPGNFNQPNHPSVSGAVYVADGVNKRVQVHYLDGLYIDHFDPGFAGVPFGTAVTKDQRVIVGDNVQGMLFVITFDRDADALFDKWEDGTAATGPNLAGLDVDPDRKDVLVEIDCMFSDSNNNGYSTTDPADHSHCPLLTAMISAVEAFANAPVNNPDGTTGIQLHLDVGPIYGAGASIDVFGVGGVTGKIGDFGGGGSQIDEAPNLIIDWDGAAGRPASNFYTLKGSNFDPARKDVFRYVLFGHQNNARAAANDCTSGLAEAVGGNDMMVTLGGQSPFGTPCYAIDPTGFGYSVGSETEQAGTFLHELGHLLGLDHGGDDPVNGKPNYLSVMSYSFQDCSVPASPTGNTIVGGCDFSRVALGQTTATRSEPHLDELSLDECFGIDGNGFGFGKMDWDGDLAFTGLSCVAPDINTVNVSDDINGDAVCIGAGPDSTLNTVASGDDVVGPSGRTIDDGADRTCNTSPAGDDGVVRMSGDVQPQFLDGFDDWGNLLYDFRSVAVFASGVTAPEPPIEADPRALGEAKDALALRLEPALSISQAVPSGTRPGTLASVAVTVRNNGRGPALDAALVSSAATTPIGAIGASEVVTDSVDVMLAGDSCQPDSSVEVQYNDFVGNPLTARAVSAVSGLACTDASVIQFAGPASGLGLGSGLGFVGVEGLINAGTPLNFTTLRVTVTKILEEDGNELVSGVPVTLTVASHFFDATALLVGAGPAGAPAVQLGLQNLGFNHYGFNLALLNATIAFPQRCLGWADNTTLKTVFTLDDGVHDVVVVTNEELWVCTGPIATAL